MPRSVAALLATAVTAVIVASADAAGGAPAAPAQAVGLRLEPAVPARACYVSLPGCSQQPCVEFVLRSVPYVPVTGGATLAVPESGPRPHCPRLATPGPGGTSTMVRRRGLRIGQGPPGAARLQSQLARALAQLRRQLPAK